METVINIAQGIFSGIADFFSGLFEGITGVFGAENSAGLIYTAVARWVFIFLAVFILLKSILSAISLNATSGSIIQNSAKWRGVLEFSARNVGPNV